MVRDLVLGLPDPLDDTPASRTERDHAAIAEVASLAPADPGECRIAIRCVTTDAWANAHLRRMNAHSEDLGTLLRLTAQAATTGRVAIANRHLLQRVQTQRQRRTPDAPADADDQAAQVAQDGLMQAWHELAEQLAQPLPKAPPPPATPAARTGATPALRHSAGPFEQLVAERRQELATAPAGAPEPDWMTPAWRLTLGLPAPPPPAEDDTRRRDLLHDADRYAITYPMRSRLIRRLGNLPPDCGIDPPPPDLLEAIRSGNEANLLWADALTPEQARQEAGRDRELLCRYEKALAETAGAG